jgi:signal transduction histidine kinase
MGEVPAYQHADAAGPVHSTRVPASDGAAVELAAKIAVALGTLLAQIREPLERLAQDAQGSQGTLPRELISSALAKVTRGDRLAAELLACAGREPLAPEAVQLLPLLCTVAHLLRCRLDERIEVTVQVDDDCPPCRVDARALEQALINLAVNACDAMPRGGRLQLVARVARLANGGPAVALTVFDSGIGMAADVVRRAALPFFTTHAGDPLAGLGLAAVEGFVRQSGGSMELRTWTGAGTWVTLCLPAASADSETAPLPSDV